MPPGDSSKSDPAKRSVSSASCSLVRLVEAVCCITSVGYSYGSKPRLLGVSGVGDAGHSATDSFGSSSLVSPTSLISSVTPTSVCKEARKSVPESVGSPARVPASPLEACPGVVSCATWRCIASQTP